MEIKEITTWGFRELFVVSVPRFYTHPDAEACGLQHQIFSLPMLISILHLYL